MSTSQEAARTLQALRDRRPIALLIAGAEKLGLAVDFAAAVGVVPSVAWDEPTVEEAAAQADAVVIDPGVTGALCREAVERSARRAVEAGRPWVLDQSAELDSKSRSDLVHRLIRAQPSVLRGSGRNILAIGLGSRGDSGLGERSVNSEEALDAAYDLARVVGCVVAVTGDVDYVTNGRSVTAVVNGHPLLHELWGAGYALSVLIAACCAVTRDVMAATVHALAIVAVAGEMAAEQAAGLASYRLRLIDLLSSLEEDTLVARARIE